MHIALLIPTVDRIGGAEHQVLLLAKGLAHRGRRVTVIALSGSGGDAASELQANKIAFLSLRMRKGLADPSGWLQLHRWIRHNQPDVVHAHLPHAGLMARWCRFLSPVRVLIETIHSPATDGALRRFAYRASRPLTDLQTAVSRAAAAPWLAERMVQPNQLAIIPNGIDFDHWKCDAEVRRAIRGKLGLGDEFVWLAVGRLEAVKDHATLLNAFAKVPANSRLLIAGAGRLEADLRRSAQQLEIQDRVHLPGFQSDVLPWMQAADAFVLTSRWEGLPMAFLEASACGLPAVCTDIPAMRELLPNLAGTLIPVGDADALATAMEAMMRQSELELSDVGSQLRRSAAGRFNLSSIVDEWEETYHALLAAKPHPTRFGSTVSLVRRNTLQLQ